MDVIIGAGISGLGYAAATKNDYVIIEKENAIGGYCKTFYNRDFVWDYSGHFFHFQRPEIRDFVMSGIKEDDMLSVKKHTQIYYKGKMIDFPFQMNIHQLEKDEFIDCLYDLFVIPENPQKGVHSFKEMLYAKFGRSISEKFLIPYNSKLYATDLDKLDANAMGRFFPYANRNEIIMNFKKNNTESYNSSFLYPKRGCIKIVDSVASHVDPSKISFNEWCTNIDLENKTVTTNKRTLHYDNLISTIPFPQLLEISHIPFNPNIYTSNKVIVFNIGFDSKGNDLVNSWVYFPDPDLIFYRIGYYDNILQQNKMSLYVEIGLSQDNPIPKEDDLLSRILLDLKKSGIITTQKMVAHNMLIMNPAYVHITQESESDKAVKQKTLSKNNVYSIGRYGEWKYCSLEDNLHDAFELAQRLQA